VVDRSLEDGARQRVVTATARLMRSRHPWNQGEQDAERFVLAGESSCAIKRMAECSARTGPANHSST
jgi:hypothetical protein